MPRTNTVIIGAGQSGLAMSHELTRHAVDHVILERGQVANSWRTERWDSLRLLTPNWMSGLAGLPYEGEDYDGFMKVSEFVEMFDRAVVKNGAPVQTQTQVLSVTPHAGGYQVQTDQGAYECQNVVMANGACGIARAPAFASEVPGNITTLSAQSYRRPENLPKGGVLVVGASASGMQIARELQMSGRPVTLAVGNHLRFPRRYRGADILSWADQLGVFETPYTEIDDLDRVRRTPSLTLTAGTETIDLNSLQAIGIEITGRLALIREGQALFSGSLHNMTAAADLKLGRFLKQIDEWIDAKGLGAGLPMATPFEPTRLPDTPRLSMDLTDGTIETVIWATGYRPDFSWLDMTVFDRKGRLMHDGGIVAEGLYAMGQPYLRTRKSTHIDGAQADARALADHLTTKLGASLAA